MRGRAQEPFMQHEGTITYHLARVAPAVHNAAALLQELCLARLRLHCSAKVGADGRHKGVLNGVLKMIFS